MRLILQDACLKHGCEPKTNGTHCWVNHKPDCPYYKGRSVTNPNPSQDRVELKPCPFCGRPLIFNEPHEIWWHGAGTRPESESVTVIEMLRAELREARAAFKRIEQEPRTPTKMRDIAGARAHYIDDTLARIGRSSS